MAGGTRAKGAPPTFTDEELAWIGENLTGLRRSISEPRILYTSLAIGFAAGLIAHVVGYLLRAAATTVPLGLVADLLYALGWSLWTGVIVVVFVQVFPEAKRRQIERALDAYEAELRAKSRSGSDQTSRDEEAPPV